MDVHAGGKGRLLVLHKGIGGHGDDGDGTGIGALKGADGASRGMAVHHRHLHIHEDGVELPGLAGLEALYGELSVLHDLHRGAFQLQQLS